MRLFLNLWHVILPVLGRTHLHLLFECLGKIQIIFKSYRIRNGCNGKPGLPEKMACLTDSIFRQIFFWGLLLICLKCTKEITSADPRIIRYILHRDRIGVTGCNIILCPLHINLPEVVFFSSFSA